MYVTGFKQIFILIIFLLVLVFAARLQLYMTFVPVFDTQGKERCKIVVIFVVLHRVTFHTLVLPMLFIVIKRCIACYICVLVSFTNAAGRLPSFDNDNFAIFMQ